MFKTLYFLVTNVFSTYLYQNLLCSTIMCPLSIWQLCLKLEWICWTGKRVTIAIPRSTDIIQVLNELKPIKNVLRYDKIDWHALHTSTTRKIRFSKKIFVCYTARPQWSPCKRPNHWSTFRGSDACFIVDNGQNPVSIHWKCIASRECQQRFVLQWNQYNFFSMSIRKLF